MFADWSVSFGYNFRVTISLRSVAGFHELAGESLKWGLCRIAIRCNIG
jgi:hypothetical protein